MNALSISKLALEVARLVRTPTRLDSAIAVADLLARDPRTAKDMAAAFRATPEGARALRERPRLGQVDLEALAGMAPHTLGHAFARHVRSAGISLDALPRRPAVDEESYVDAHLYEVHDIWHVLTGFDVSIGGELGVLAFGLAKLPSRFAVILLGAGLLQTYLRDFHEYEDRMEAIVQGWRMGKDARSVLGVEWNRLWSEPLAEVRSRFGITPTSTCHSFEAAATASCGLRPSDRSSATSASVEGASSAS